MAPPLVEVFSDPTYSVHTRDEALLYLALEGGETAKSIILAAHATPPEDEDDYLFTRGLLGLMLLDDVDLLKHQIANSLEHFDIEALAACLVGSSDPKGKEIAERLTTHPTAKVRQAVAGARASVGTTSDNEVQNVLETIRTTTRRLYSIGSYFSRLQIRRSVHVVLYRAKSKTGLDFYSYIRCDQRQFEKMAADYRNKLACEDASEYGEVVYTRLGNEPDAEAERFLADYLKGMNDRFGKSAALAGTMANEPRSQKNDTVSDDA